jgi:hypothetical protein
LLLLGVDMVDGSRDRPSKAARAGPVGGPPEQFLGYEILRRATSRAGRARSCSLPTPQTSFAIKSMDQWSVPLECSSHHTKKRRRNSVLRLAHIFVLHVCWLGRGGVNCSKPVSTAALVWVVNDSSGTLSLFDGIILVYS